jgi:PTH1 family peptidyl-tRNA hydrolase
MQPILLVCGLGNPGDKYAQTRHNAGFWFLGKLTYALPVALSENSRFKSLLGEYKSAGNSLRVLAPQTFMNKSGEALAPLAKFYQIAPENILVVHDEIDLDPGVVRLKTGGGHGGHNGLRDIIRHLGSNDFHRLRVGVGRPDNSNDVVNEVLKRPPLAEYNLIDEALDRVMAQWETIVVGDFAPAMNVLHQK